MERRQPAPPGHLPLISLGRPTVTLPEDLLMMNPTHAGTTGVV